MVSREMAGADVHSGSCYQRELKNLRKMQLITLPVDTQKGARFIRWSSKGCRARDVGVPISQVSAARRMDYTILSSEHLKGGDNFSSYVEASEMGYHLKTCSVCPFSIGRKRDVTCLAEPFLA